MDTAPGDDEAPKDPGALQTHHLGYTEKDFEGNYKIVSYFLCKLSGACFWGFTMIQQIGLQNILNSKPYENNFCTKLTFSFILFAC